MAGWTRGGLQGVRRHLRTGLRRLRPPTGALLIVLLAGAPLIALAEPVRAGRLCFLMTFFGGLLLVLLSVSGGPGAEYRSGVALLWLQKRGSLVRFYTTRLIGRILAGWIALLLVASVSSLMILILGVPATSLPLRTVPGLLVGTLTVAGIVHATSGLGVSRDAFVSLLVLCGLIAARVSTVLSLADPTLLRYILSAVALPIDQIAAIGSWDFSALEAGPVGSLLHVSVYIGCWIAIGTLGLWWAEHRRFPGAG